MSTGNKWFGTREFYRSVLMIAVPIMIQSGITTFVNMLDNIMVGQVGTLPMSGVSITNQLIMIFNLAVFGSFNAAGIFGAQFCGKQDDKGVRDCFHFKLYVVLLLSAAGLGILGLCGRQLIGLYLDPAVNSPADILETMQYARKYMLIMMIGLPVFTLSQAFSTSIRETGETIIPMRASICAVTVNFIGNYTLIFGHFGMPRLGIAGAAVATVISRFVELSIILTGAVRHRERFAFMHDPLKDMRVPVPLVKAIILKGAPLVVNEVLWSTAIAMIAQCYSTRGLSAVAAININQTIQNVFTITNNAMGNSISIMVGQRLGANETEEAVDTDRKLIVFSFCLASVMGCLLFMLAPLFPGLYNTSAEVQALAGRLLRVTAFSIPFGALYFGAYFTLRSGGKTVITFLFDSVYSCLVNYPIAFGLSRFTDLPVLYIFIVVVCADIPKAVLGLFLVHKRVWVQNLVGTGN
ncbi:MAG: MATE family efflux transporter [Solobacterium sp.]|nr:MATE family efflux transporter [Solobacterium sp.]MBQ6532979.1 MATE family efflux transporter [Solobacterium sp.]